MGLAMRSRGVRGWRRAHPRAPLAHLRPSSLGSLMWAARPMRKLLVLGWCVHGSRFRSGHGGKTRTGPQRRPNQAR